MSNADLPAHSKVRLTPRAIRGARPGAGRFLALLCSLAVVLAATRGFDLPRGAEYKPLALAPVSTTPPTTHMAAQTNLRQAFSNLQIGASAQLPQGLSTTPNSGATVKFVRGEAGWTTTAWASLAAFVSALLVTVAGVALSKDDSPISLHAVTGRPTLALAAQSSDDVAPVAPPPTQARRPSGGKHIEPETCKVVEGTMVCELVPDEVPPEDPLEFEGGTEESPLVVTETQSLGVVLTWLLLISPFFMWGTSMVAMKETIEHTTPLFIAGVRCVPAGLIILAFCALKGKPVLPKSLAAWAWVSAFAIVDATMFQGFLAEGLRRTSAGLGSVIIDSQPLTVAVLASVFFGEAMGRKGILGLVLGLIGIGLVELAPENIADLMAFNTGGTWFTGSIWDRGEWWMLLAAQSMAIGTVMVRLFAKEVDPVLATGWHLLLGGIPLFILSTFLDGPLTDQMALLTTVDWLRLSYVSIFGGAVGYGLFFYAAERGSLTRLSSLTFLTPMFAVLGGYIFLNESLSPIQALGAVVTLVAIYLINSPRKNVHV